MGVARVHIEVETFLVLGSGLPLTPIVLMFVLLPVINLCNSITCSRTFSAIITVRIYRKQHVCFTVSANFIILNIYLRRTLLVASLEITMLLVVRPGANDPIGC